MNIIIKIGEMGQVIETHEFSNENDAGEFLKSRVPQLNNGHIREIMSHADTQFEIGQMLNFPEQQSAYWANVRYEIEVK